jgi:putative glutamine amidotransferase
VRALRIGLSACFFHADPLRPIFKGKTLLYLEQSLARWVMAQGALCYLVPDPGPAPGMGVDLAALAKPLDGLVLQGGSDVSPLTYGEAPLKAEWSGDAIRDAYEIELVRAFRTQGKPVLGICRGAQLLNVAFGGTLYQDLGTQRPGSPVHRDWDLYDQNFHGLRLGGRLAGLAGASDARVNSVHHQAVRELGAGLVAEAYSREDGLVEAFRAVDGPHLFAVQWHPEFQDPGDAGLLDGTVFLKDFLKAAGEGVQRV